MILVVNGKFAMVVEDTTLNPVHTQAEYDNSYSSTGNHDAASEVLYEEQFELLDLGEEGGEKLPQVYMYT